MMILTIASKEITCKRCGVTKPLDQFKDSNYGPLRKRTTCRACDLEYQHQYNRRHRTKVNVTERINRIVAMDSQAKKLLSCNDRQGLRILAGQMKEFGMTQRARELEEYA